MKVVNPQPLAPNEFAVEILEDMLVAAKNGELRAVAVAAVLKDNTVTTAFNEGIARFQLLGGVSYLQHRINGEFAND